MDWEIYSVPAVHRQISQWSVSHTNLYITISKQLTLRQEPTLLKSLTSHYIYDKNASVRLLWFHTGHKLCWVKLLWLFNPTVLDLFPLQTCHSFYTILTFYSELVKNTSVIVESTSLWSVIPTQRKLKDVQVLLERRWMDNYPAPRSRSSMHVIACVRKPGVSIIIEFRE